MCYRPLKLVHRSNHFNKDSNPLYLNVPCGKCLDCQRMLKDEWFVRVYGEWKLRKGSVLFYTLTYNEENIPRYKDVKCFSREHLQLFLKRFRKQLWSYYKVKLRYLITSEYGELYRRPHYHALFFLDAVINPFAFRILLQKCWYYGFVKAGDNVGQVYGYTALKYVTKYICKDYAHEFNSSQIVFDILHKCRMLFIRSLRFLARHESFNNYLSSWFSKLRFTDIEFNVYSDRINSRHFMFSARHNANILALYDKIVARYRKYVSSLTPFHLQSSKFGFEFLKTLSEQEILNEKIKVPTQTGFRDASMPRYFKRKLFYDMMPNEKNGKKTLYKLNDAGKQHLIDKIDKDIQDLTEKIDFIKSLRPHELPTTFSLRPFDNALEAQFFLRNANPSSSFLAVYMLVFRNRVIDSLDHDSLHYFTHYKDYYSSFVNEESQTDLGKIYERRNRLEGLKSSLYNSHPAFFGMEVCSLIYMQITNIRSEQKAAINEANERNLRKLKQITKYEKGNH